MILDVNYGTGTVNNPGTFYLDSLLSGTDVKDYDYATSTLDNREWFTMSDHAMELNWDYIESTYGFSDGVLMGWNIQMEVNSEIGVTPTLPSLWVSHSIAVIDKSATENLYTYFGGYPTQEISLDVDLTTRYAPIWGVATSFICYVPKGVIPQWESKLIFYSGKTCPKSLTGEQLGIQNSTSGGFNIYSDTRIQAYLII